MLVDGVLWILWSRVACSMIGVLLSQVCGLSLNSIPKDLQVTRKAPTRVSWLGGLAWVPDSGCKRTWGVKGQLSSGSHGVEIVRRSTVNATHCEQNLRGAFHSPPSRGLTVQWDFGIEGARQCVFWIHGVVWEASALP